MNNDQLTIGNDQLPEGYKQTEIRVIPEDWQPYRVGDVVSFSGGSQPPRSTFVFKPKTGYLRLIQIRDYKTDVYETYIPEELAKKKCTEQDVMIGRYGPPIFQILRGIEGAYNVAIIKTIPSEKIDREFLYQFIRNDELFKLMEMLSQRSSGQTGVELPALREYPVALPPLEEQRSIAQALSDVDRLIAALDRAIAKKRAIKTATMQQLLTGEKRLPGFLGNWTDTQIGTEIDLLTGYPFPSANYSDSGIKLLRGSNIKRGETDWAEDLIQYWSEITPDISQYVLKDGDIVVAMDGSLVGRSFARLSKADLPALLLQRVARIRSEKIDVGYLKEWICSKFFTEHCDAVKTVTAIPHISSGDIRSFRIRIPPTHEEQRAIATVLSDMDAEIAALETRLAKTQALKQGMMQALLTGRVRLV